MDEKRYSVQGTETEMNLQKAFEGEAIAAMKYRLFADNAEEAITYSLLLELADNEEEHAEQFLEMLGGINDTPDNLKRSIALEGFESGINYPEMAKVAIEEGFSEIAKEFSMVAAIEAHHKTRLEEHLKRYQLRTLFKAKQEVEWECMKCGHIHKGIEPPLECPVCHHKAKDFKQEKIYY